MAPTIKWQRWEAAAYDWQGTDPTDALPSLEAELDAWIAAINAHAGNAGKQITKMRGAADSTADNYAGLVLRYGANGNTEYAYSHYGTRGSTSSRSWSIGTGYTDDTSVGGYGTISGGMSDTSVSWRKNGYDADWLVVYDTTEGQEFFSFGPRLGGSSNAYMDGFTIFKSHSANWCFVSADGSSSSQMAFHYFDDAVSTGWSGIERSSGDSCYVRTGGMYSRYELYPTSTGTGVSTFSGPGQVYAANPYMFSASSSSTYYLTGTRRILTDVSPNNDYYLLTMYYYGPTILVDVRP